MNLSQKFSITFVVLLSLALTAGSFNKPEKKSTAGDTYSAVLGKLQTNYYGLVHLALATAAYTDNPDTGSIVNAFQAEIEDSLSPLPSPWGSGTLANTKWTLEWGPALSPDNSNLVCVVTCSVTDTIYFRAVILRGTDIASTYIGIINQLTQDLNAFKQTDMVQYFNDSLQTYNSYNRQINTSVTCGNISCGTAGALKKVLGLTPPNGAPGADTSLIQHLESVHAENTPLVVTGHSLGGALTQAVSAFLAWQLDNAYQGMPQPQCSLIFPNAFAPPTAGDNNFAAVYDSLFPYNYFWYNKSDVVPHAFCSVDSIEALWGSYVNPEDTSETGPPCPLDAVINKLSPKLPNYTRPSNNIIWFTASYVPNPPNPITTPDAWVNQLIYQHFPYCYYEHLSLINGLAPYNPYKFTPMPLRGMKN